MNHKITNLGQKETLIFVHVQVYVRIQFSVESLFPTYTVLGTLGINSSHNKHLSDYLGLE